MKSGHSDQEIAQMHEDLERQPPHIGCSYRHYKGGRYVVVTKSLDEEALTPLVTYVSLSRNTYWTRTRENFMGMTPHGDRRFAPVIPEEERTR